MSLLELVVSVCGVARSFASVEGQMVCLSSCRRFSQQTLTEPLNVGLGDGGLGLMADYRFRQIKSVYPFAFQHKQAERDGDPWHMILLGLEGFNKSRNDWIAASVMKILDESMSAWCPQSTKTGGLPEKERTERKNKTRTAKK